VFKRLSYRVVEEIGTGSTGVEYLMTTATEENER
jgi:hypothetical protein